MTDLSGKYGDIESGPSQELDVPLFKQSHDNDDHHLIGESLGAPSLILPGGDASVGSSPRAAREDHVHPRIFPYTGAQNSSIQSTTQIPNNLNPQPINDPGATLTPVAWNAATHDLWIDLSWVTELNFAEDPSSGYAGIARTYIFYSLASDPTNWVNLGLRILWDPDRGHTQHSMVGQFITLMNRVFLRQSSPSVENQEVTYAMWGNVSPVNNGNLSIVGGFNSRITIYPYIIEKEYLTV